MLAGFETTTLALVFAVVCLGGVVKGAAGFGYDVTGTAALAVLIDPVSASLIMIVPMIAANLSLVGELDRSDVRPCAARFWLFLVAAIAGTALGVFALDILPVAALTFGIGVITLGYVASRQKAVEVPGLSNPRLADTASSKPAGAAIGLASGVVYGATNIAVQVVAYLDSHELDYSTFVGVLAVIVVGISGVRLALAWELGMYGTNELLAVSVVASAPGLVGVGAGAVLRRRLAERTLHVGVLVLLSVIGVRLVLDGAGFV
ncbi:MAG: sulfite exporter TauE/SafE family protein [Halobacteriales archaeon]|nr:sulfite exporter TauE/SafE family protein [Halobacteriales archaeon]